MTPTKHSISASEIGAYLYCQRSWSYQRRGHTSANIEILERGELAHQQHARGLQGSQRLRFFAFALIAMALIIFLFR